MTILFDLFVFQLPYPDFRMTRVGIAGFFVWGKEEDADIEEKREEDTRMNNKLVVLLIY
jgi:hypothetical protein